MPPALMNTPTSLQTAEVVNHHPLRIIHITTTAVGGGAAKVMFDLASAQRAAGHAVQLVSIAPRTEPPAWLRATIPMPSVNMD